MENTWSWDNTAVDYTLLEKVNPVFNTAKMTLFQLAANGDRDAAALAKSMGLTLEATQNSANTKASPEQVLTGRLDTITAPSLLSFFEKTKAEQAITAVQVDCSRLEYISSAGLRVLLIMHKACTGGVSLYGETEAVGEILEQTGFDSIFHR